MALIDKETIRAEIERRMTENCALAEKADCFGQRAVEDNDILSFLDTLPEQPVKGLEEELKRYINSDEYINTRESCLLLVARHFYELGCRHVAVLYDDIEFERQRRAEEESKGLEEATEDLDDAAYTWVMDNFGNPKESPFQFDIRCFKVGAEWQRKKDQQLIELAEDHAMLAGMNKMKEEMMEKAVEGVVQDDGQFINFGDGRYIDLDPTMGLKPVFELTDGEKVKVIVIPEEK